MRRTLLSLAALAAALTTTACQGTDPIVEPPAPPAATVLELELPAVPQPATAVQEPAPVVGDCGDYCGTDAGLVPPLPMLDEYEQAAAPVFQADAPAQVTAPPVVDQPAAAPVFHVEPSPAPAAVSTPVQDAPVQEQLPEERQGRDSECVGGGAVLEDGTWGCPNGVVQ